MRHTLRCSATFPLDRESVFRFFADASNLQRLTPPELCFQILTPLPIQLGEGTLIDYRLKLCGIPFYWRTCLTAWEPPRRFVDEQLRGPYRLWVHEHRFEEAGGATTVHDEVNYRLPLWPVGEAAYPLVRRQLERVFRYRQGAIRAALARQHRLARPF